METIQNELATYFQTDASDIELQKCSNGDVNATYIACCQQKKAIVKIQKSVALPYLYENQILREEIGTRLCMENEIPCPRIIAANQHEGYIITEYIAHPLLADVWKELSAEERVSVKKQALSMIDRMNQIRLPLFGALYQNGRIGQFPTWEQAFQNIMKVALCDCHRFGVLTAEECKRIEERAEHNCTGIENDTMRIPVFAHMDFHWKNMFYDRKQHRITCLFDFGSAISTVDYMGYYRLEGGFLYGTERFYTQGISAPISINAAQQENAWLYNTLDYLTFLAYQGKEKNRDEVARLRKGLGIA